MKGKAHKLRISRSGVRISQGAPSFVLIIINIQASKYKGLSGASSSCQRHVST